MKFSNQEKIIFMKVAIFDNIRSCCINNEMTLVDEKSDEGRLCKKTGI